MLMMVVLLLILGGSMAQSPCNGTHPYVLAGSCYIQCPWVSPTQYYSYAPNFDCRATCPPGFYAFNGNLSCVSTCPTSPNMTYYDDVNGKCVAVCPANYFAATNRTCLQSCPSATWGDSVAWTCVSTCPAGTFYANSTVPLCVTRCPANFYGYPVDRACYAGGSCPVSPVKYYADDTTNQCVEVCPSGYYKDDSTGRCLRFCTSGFFADMGTGACLANCPAGSFRSVTTRLCVSQCTQGEFADSATSNCTTHCSSGTFGDSSTGKCASECSYPLFGDSSVGLCVSICSAGLYADNQTMRCVAAVSCYSNTVGDPTTNKCINPQDCPTSPLMFADLANKICTTRCASTWGDSVSRTCVGSCPWNPQTYVTWSNPDTRQCVTVCPEYPVMYADNHTKACVATCPQQPTVSHSTYADPLSQSCVDVCPTGFYADLASLSCVTACDSILILQFFSPLNGSCVSVCPTGYFAELSTLKCVLSCSASPRYYAFEGNSTCLEVCPLNYFGDNSTGRCVTACPQTTGQFADPSTRLCVDSCPLSPDSFGLVNIDSTLTCESVCPVGLFADPITRNCLTSCDITKGYYGELVSPLRRCVIQCNSNWFKNNLTAQCVSSCPNFPSKLFGDPGTTFCVSRCPPHFFGNPSTNLCGLPTACPANHFADNSTNLCVSRCPADQSTFGDSSSRSCLQTCPQGTYADPTTRLCSSGCSTGLFKDPSSKKCVTVCPSIPNLYADPNTGVCVESCSSSWYAYDGLRKCVAMCPSTPPLYANLQTFRCVSSCPRDTYIFTNNTFRGCLEFCPRRIYSSAYQVTLFADNTTWSCVQVCPQARDLYAFSHPDNLNIRICVSTCPMVNGSVYYFNENVTQSCVTRCPFDTQLTYGDTFSSRCELSCSRNQYRDNTTARCVYECSPGYFADNSTWNCVLECPVGTYAETLNRTCSLNCPTGYYADNSTRYCVALCNQTDYLFSDNTTWKCVSQCSAAPDYYSDNNTRTCTERCSGGLFTDPPSRTCMPALNCSNSLVGEPLSGRCIATCPIEVPSFLDEATNECVQSCPPGFFADNSTMFCVPECPSAPDFFAFNHSTRAGLCLLFCPVSPVPYYRHAPTRECLSLCPGPSYFRDTTTMRCVLSCPPYYYAETINQICVLNCSANSKYGFNGVCYERCPNNLKADPTTFLCVEVCPFGLFAQNQTCVAHCNGTADVLFADPFLKECVSVCSADYFAYLPTNECRQNCQPLYKYFANQSCETACPVSSSLATNLYRDNKTYSCLNKCLPGEYADNVTGYCQVTCSATLLADNSTGLCVEKCPSTPDYYGYNLVCHQPCPATVPPVYAENVSRTCLPTCPASSYADSFNRRCVAVCSDLQYGHLGPPPVCVSKCPSPLYGHNATKTCIPVCPSGTFGENTTRVCLERCPSGTYADSHLNLCVSQCSASLPQFADDSTQKCVSVCPSIPSLYGEFLTAGPKCVPSCQTSGWFTLNTTRLCVTNCPSPYFADPVTLDCAEHCQINYNYYADNSTRTCSTTCPQVSVGGAMTYTYADDSTKRCVWQCPFSPSLYGDNFTAKCVAKCPANSFGDNDTRLCLGTCFFNVNFNGVTKFTYAENTTTFCLSGCPPGSWADNLTYQCVSLCSEGTFADNSTWRCVLMCPSNPRSFSYSPTRQCLHYCPGTFFASDSGRQCMNMTCPTTPFFYYRDYSTQTCLLKCVFPYFGEVSSQSCTTTCSYGFYQDLGSMTCAKCPSACLTCLNEANCDTCQPGLYKYAGQCVTSCPTFPVYYYKYDTSFSCIENCPSPYFGFAGTGKCELTCPGTYYKNETTSSCMACPSGCDGCYSNNCSSCITGYVHVSKFSTCSKMCSLAAPYFSTGSCVQSCARGTFLLEDLVTCQKCSSICAECSQLATNCTKCEGKFWYNYNCVDKCPDSYYVDSSNACRQCSNNPSLCQLPPLSYEVSTEVVSYDLFVVVTFNREVSLTAEQFLRYAKLETSEGPIKASDYLIVLTTSLLFRLKILNSASLNELSLRLSFEPGVIFDLSGTGLSTMTATIPVPVTSSISVAEQQQGQALNSKVDAVSWLLIAVLLLMMVRCSYPLIVLIDLLQYIHLHVYLLLAPLPYLFMQAVSALKNVNFAFLPTLYSDPSPDPFSSYYDFQKDTTFIGNCQPFVFFLAIFGGAYFICYILTFEFNKIKCLRRFCKKVYRTRMRYSFLHQIFYYTGFYVLFFAFYQFTGANSSINQSAANLAAAVIVIICYCVWLVAITYLASKYRKRLDKMPKKYQFLVYEDSQFPMQIPLRALFKFIVALVLIAGEVSVQLVLLMVFNCVYIVYTVCYTPSKRSLTNYLNVALMVGLIVCEIVLFLYMISDKNSSYQNLISIVELALIGVMVFAVLVWIIYRFVLHVRHEWLGVPYPVEKEPKKRSSVQLGKSEYEKIGKSLKQSLTSQKYKLEDKDKQMNISELNFNDQDDRSDAPEITAEQAIQMFTYHHIPKKTQGQVKYENELIGIKEQKKEHKQIVIQLDEDELIDNVSPDRVDSKQSNRFRKQHKRLKSSQKGLKGHLRIEAEDSLQELQDVNIKEKTEKQSQPESEQSNYWTRRERRKAQEKKKVKVEPEPEENKVVWDEYNAEEHSLD